MNNIIPNIAFKQTWQELECKTNQEDNLKYFLELGALSCKYPPRTRLVSTWAGLGFLGCTGLAGPCWAALGKQNPLHGTWSVSCKYPPGIHPAPTRDQALAGQGWLCWAALAWLGRSGLRWASKTRRSLSTALGALGWLGTKKHVYTHTKTIDSSKTIHNK